MCLLAADRIRASYKAIADTAAKVDRALQAGAHAVGASVEIDTVPGYMPLIVDRGTGCGVQAQRAGACPD
jgi:hypothetical protein